MNWVGMTGPDVYFESLLQDVARKKGISSPATRWRIPGERRTASGMRRPRASTAPVPASTNAGTHPTT